MGKGVSLADVDDKDDEFVNGGLKNLWDYVS